MQTLRLVNEPMGGGDGSWLVQIVVWFAALVTALLVAIGTYRDARRGARKTAARGRPTMRGNGDKVDDAPTRRLFSTYGSDIDEAEVPTTVLDVSTIDDTELAAKTKFNPDYYSYTHIGSSDDEGYKYN